MAYHETKNPLPVYSNKDFDVDNTTCFCDVVMKGGITSGVVYPFAMLYLAMQETKSEPSGPGSSDQQYRFAGVGGSSVGAVAAAFTVAAEYAREKAIQEEAGDLKQGSGFLEFQSASNELGKGLSSYFQPSPQYRSVFASILAMMAFQVKLSASDDKSLGGLKGGMRAFSGTNFLNWALLLFLVCPVIAIAIVVFLSDANSFVSPTSSYFTQFPFLKLLVLPLFVAWVCFAAILGAITWHSWLPVIGCSFLLAFIFVMEVGYFAANLPASLFLSGIAGLLVINTGLMICATLIANNLVASNFGMCTGKTQGLSSNNAKLGLTDWLNQRIQTICGRPNCMPLTFTDIEDVRPATSGPKLRLRMMVTNLTLSTAHALPGIEQGSWYFCPDDWLRLFPDEIMSYLEKEFPAKTYTEGTRTIVLSQIMDPFRLPILVGLRMSLGFPVLFEAVPVYRRNTNGFERMLIVDGGLTSNLPIHFFDSLAPCMHPTFAFSLDEYLATDSGPEVTLKKTNELPPLLQATEFKRFSGYLKGLLSAPQGWHDNTLSQVRGNVDRIVRVGLKPGEGGLNLVMPPSKIYRLMRKGHEAGEVICKGLKGQGPFEPDKHRMLRAEILQTEGARAARDFKDKWEGGLKEMSPFNKNEKFVALANWIMSGAEIHSEETVHAEARKVRLGISPDISGN